MKIWVHLPYSDTNKVNLPLYIWKSTSKQTRLYGMVENNNWHRKALSITQQTQRHLALDSGMFKMSA